MAEVPLWQRPTQPRSRAECELLISAYEWRRSKGLQRIEETRPQSIDKLKAEGIDLEKDATPSVLAPADALLWLANVSLTKEAEEVLEVVKKAKREFEAQEAGEELRAPLHQQTNLLFTITEALADAMQSVGPVYEAFKQSVKCITTSLGKATSGTSGVSRSEAAHWARRDDDQPLLAPQSRPTAPGLRQRMLTSTS